MAVYRNKRYLDSVSTYDERIFIQHVHSSSLDCSAYSMKELVSTEDLTINICFAHDFDAR